jgi:hypothetical protein
VEGHRRARRARVHPASRGRPDRDAQARPVGVKLTLSLVKNGQPVDLGDGIFAFVNPPLAVDVALTPTQINALRSAFSGGVPTQAQIDTWLTNRGFAPASHTLRYRQDRDGIWQFRLLEEAPLKALRDALVGTLKDRIA